MLTLLALVWKGACIVAMLAAPLLAVWIASSLAAFTNRTAWLPVACGLLLFPGLPLAWDGVAAWRRRGKRDESRRFLTFGDRLILRTLVLAVGFLVALLAAFPERGFLALATRGDWMLDGRSGPTVDRARRALFAAAGGLEWLYRAAHENPYRAGHEGRDAVPEPSARPPASTAAAASASSSASVSPSASASASGSAAVSAPSSATPVASAAPVASIAASASASASAAATASAPGVDTTVAPAAPAYPFPAELHPLVTGMPKEAEESIESVGRYVAEREKDPFLRVKALHDWVADRIAYDAQAYLAYLKGTPIPQSAGDGRSVFAARRGVCAGYSDLMVRLGRVTGDEIVYVVGDVRSHDSPMVGAPHAWNGVQIAGQRYVLDATWDAGHLTDGAFVKRYRTAYFLTPPAHFVASHFPDNPTWQVLSPTLSRGEFLRRPAMAPTFFASGLELLSPDRSQVPAEGSLHVKLANPRRVPMLANVTTRGSTSTTNCAGDSLTTFECSFPGQGTFDVNLFVGTRGDTYDHAGTIQVNAHPLSPMSESQRAVSIRAEGGHLAERRLLERCRSIRIAGSTGHAGLKGFRGAQCVPARLVPRRPRQGGGRWAMAENARVEASGRLRTIGA